MAQKRIFEIKKLFSVLQKLKKKNRVSIKIKMTNGEAKKHCEKKKKKNISTRPALPSLLVEF